MLKVVIAWCCNHSLSQQVSKDVNENKWFRDRATWGKSPSCWALKDQPHYLKERAQRKANYCLRLPMWRGKSTGIRDSSAGYKSLRLKNETKKRVLNCHIWNNLSSKFAIPASLAINTAVIQNSSFRNEMLNEEVYEILCPVLSKTE